MKILIVTQYFYPENFKSNDIAFEMAKRGHKVDVLSAIPNYPQGKFYKGYGILKKRREIVNGVHIYRSFQFPRGKGGGLRLIANYLSYVLTASFNVLFFFCFKKYDRIIVHEVSPIFQAYPALLLKKIRKVPVYLWVLDLWPDAMKSGGGVKSKKILHFVDRLVCGIYRGSDKILISSKRFRHAIVEKGDFNDKIVYFPNWSDDMSTDMVSDKKIDSLLPKGFNILLAGNLGKAQNLESIMDTVLLLKDVPSLNWIFVGDGSKKKWLDDFITEHQLEKKVFALGRFPANSMPYFFSRADALLLTLRGDFPHLQMVVPARLQSYMSSGKPVLGMIDGGAADIIKEANCGTSVPAGDSKGLADTIQKDILPNIEAWKAKGINGREYYMNNFTKEICIDNLEKILL